MNSHLISEAQCGANGVLVVWNDGRKNCFPFLWLRDNCAKNFHPQTQERVFDMMTVPLDIRPVTLKLAGDSVEIDWGNHNSSYSADWLRSHIDHVESRPRQGSSIRMWDLGDSEEIPRFSYPDLADDGEFCRYLSAVRDWGLGLVSDMPCRPEELTIFAERISWLRETNFGREFDVISKPNPNNVAYTALELFPHTDLPNREMPPGIQFLHCLVNDTNGGASVFVDGFRIADELRRRDPEAFAVLTTRWLPFRFHDEGFDLRWRAPTIRLDDRGCLQEVRYHTALTAPIEAGPEEMTLIYRALRAFTELTRDPAFVWDYRLKPGEMVAFHNRRLLHGRRSFDPSEGERRLRGCYVDWDEWTSRIRVLERGRQGRDAAA